jgi:hypothetical protein
MLEHSKSLSVAPEGYVNAERIIEILFPNGGISLRFFRKLQAQGRIPYLKIGRKTMFIPSEVKAALEKRSKRHASA